MKLREIVVSLGVLFLFQEARFLSLFSLSSPVTRTASKKSGGVRRSRRGRGKRERACRYEIRLKVVKVMNYTQRWDRSPTKFSPKYKDALQQSREIRNEKG